MKKAGIEGMATSSGLSEATKVLNLMSHGDRLRVLCNLSTEGELTVGQLLERIELSGSALSQHLAKLRRHGLVATRRDRQNVYYRIGRDDVEKILGILYRLYCD